MLERDDALTWLSLRNAAAVHIVAVDQLNTYDVLPSDDVVFTKGAYDAFVAGAPQGKSVKAVAPTETEEACQVSTLHKDHRDILIAPVVSEKSYGLLDANKYTFLVRPDANKTEIKIAVEKVFNVKVTSVNTHQPSRARRVVPATAWASARTPSARSSASPRATASTSSEVRSPDRAPETTRTENSWLSASTSRPPRAVVARRWPTSSRSPGPRRRSR